MKAGGDSVSPSRAPRQQLQNPTDNYTVWGAGLILWGVTQTGYSTYYEVAEAKGIVHLAGIGGMGIGVGMGLAGTGFLMASSGDSEGRRFRLSGGYLASLGTIAGGVGSVISGLKYEQNTEVYIGSFLSAAGVGLLGYTVYKDIQGGRQGEPSLLGDLVANFTIGPNGVGTAVRF